MLGDVARNVLGDLELPRRPHTACAGARICTVVSDDGDDTESDRGSLDPDDEPAEQLQDRSVGENSETDTKDGSALGYWCGPLSLSRGEWLLLSGLEQRVHQPEAHPTRQTSADPQSCEQRTIVKASPMLLAEKLPRTRVFGACRGGGLAPQASRFKSHTSWTNFLPIGAPGARLSTDVRQRAVPESRQPSGYPAEVETIDTELQAAQDSKDEPEVLRQAGPKYRVLPGGSRPAASKVKVSKELVLEFRSEPRVVPARRSQEEVRHGGRRGWKRSEIAPLQRLRQEDGQWALEREALARAR
ncbi:unnamed protein product [Durusdinium trenchii]